MIRTRDLTKQYGKFTAVNGLNLNIAAGEVYGFLGPNGAGKTTTIMMLLGVLRPTRGEISLFGERFHPGRLDLRRRVGVVPEKHPVGMWPWMTVTEYLQTFADLFSLRNAGTRIADLLDRVGLIEVRNKRFSGLSRGMLQKLSIVRALLHDPDILFLDEPVSGLDPFGIRQVRDLILEENREGRAIFISSHILSEMERICDRVAIIGAGKLIVEDAMDSLRTNLARERELEIELEEYPPGLIERISELPFVIEAQRKHDRLLVKVPRSGEYRGDLSRHLIEQNLVPLGIRERSRSLEEAFVTITQDNLDLFAGGRRPEE